MFLRCFTSSLISLDNKCSAEAPPRPPGAQVVLIQDHQKLGVPPDKSMQLLLLTFLNES